MRHKKSRHSTLKEKILEILENSPGNQILKSDLANRLRVKNEKVYRDRSSKTYLDMGWYKSQFYKTLREMEEENKIVMIPYRPDIKRFKADLLIKLVRPEDKLSKEEVETIMSGLRDKDEKIKLSTSQYFANASSKKITHDNELFSLIGRELKSRDNEKYISNLILGLWRQYLYARSQKDEKILPLIGSTVKGAEKLLFEDRISGETKGMLMQMLCFTNRERAIELLPDLITCKGYLRMMEFIGEEIKSWSTEDKVKLFKKIREVKATTPEIESRIDSMLYWCSL